jgi:4'-phosphopantetheinyl transferase EntD
VNAAPRIAALFPQGTVAYQTHDTISAATLLPEEQQSLLRAAPKRIAEFAAGRACARAALAQLGYSAVALPAGTDRAPCWPSGATGSITHTHGYCAAAVAATTQMRALGLDAEPQDSVKPHLWRRICGPEELAMLLAQDEKHATAAATLIFSAKEAFYKCQHTLTGEWLGFTDISISFNIESGHISVRPTRSLQIADLHPGPWQGRYLHEQGLLITAFCIV